MRSHVHSPRSGGGSILLKAHGLRMFSPGKQCVVIRTRGLDAEQAEASLCITGTETVPVLCMPCLAHSKCPRHASHHHHRHHFARGGGWSPLTPGWGSGPIWSVLSPYLSVSPRWSCHPMRKPCLCHTRFRRGAQHHPHTQRRDIHQAPALVLGGAELPRNPLLCLGGPCGLGEPPG